MGAAAILNEAAHDPASYRRRYEARDRAVKLIVDHAIPINVIVGSLFAGDVELTRDAIRAHVTKWYCLGLLSHDKDARLSQMGLRSMMPGGWDRTILFARYEAAGIEMCCLSAVA